MAPEAVDYWQMAGQRAVQHWANLEAINHLRLGLDRRSSLPETPERVTQEVALQTMLGQSFLQTRGYSTLEVQAALSRARELIDQIGDTSQYFQVTFGLYLYYLVRAEYESALEVAEPCLEAAERSQDPFPLRLAHRNMGTILYFSGEAPRAREHLLQAIHRYDLDERRSLARAYGQEPMSTGMAWTVKTLWLLGYPDQASNLIQEAVVNLAQEISHPFTLAFVEVNAARQYIQFRGISSAIRYAEAVVNLVNEQAFDLFPAFATAAQGACWARMGRDQEGISSLSQGLSFLAGIGSKFARSQCLSWLAEARLLAGQTEVGLTVLDEAFSHLSDTGERYWEPELYRIKGELLLSLGERETESEECFNQGLEVAKRQSAKSLELRAALSLARLWQNQGKAREARELLAGIYGWFTEGFDTPDLVDAKARLQELSRS